MQLAIMIMLLYPIVQQQISNIEIIPRDETKETAKNAALFLNLGKNQWWMHV